MGTARVRDVVQDTPHMDLDQAELLSSFVREHGITDVLELGFRHGVSTCYLAEALRPAGGHITTIDLANARHAEPNVEQLLEKLDLRDIATVHYEPTSYTWRLMKMIEEDPTPRFDLCYLDGAHTWAVDGLAFFLVDKLLRPGGWIVFDDLTWSLDTSETLRNADWVQALPDDERTIPQVQQVFELLVKQHPDYGDFRVEPSVDWAMARKLRAGERAQVVTERVVVREKVGLGAVAERALRRLKRSPS